MDTSAATRVVDALVGEGVVPPGSRARATEIVARTLGADSAETAVPSRGRSQVVEVVAYLGGALVLVAAGLFVAQEWAGLGFGTRTALLVMAVLVLGGAGVVAGRGRPQSDVRRRLGGTLLTAAGLAAAFLVGYVVEELTHLSTTEVYWPGVAGAAAGALVAGVGYRLVPTAVGQVGVLGGLLIAVGNAVGGVPEGVPGADGDHVGLVFLGIAVGWVLLAEHAHLGERGVARALGCATALLGAQLPVVDGTHAGLGYALTVLASGAAVAAYLRLQAWPYLALAVLGVTLVVPEAVTDWTAGSLGAVGGVLLAGVTLLVAGLAGLRLREQVT